MTLDEKASAVGEALTKYVRMVSVNETDVLRRLREETARLPNAQMQISPEQGQFMRVLLTAIGAKRTLEVGVFTGYSSISTAMALPADGRVLACDMSEEYTNIARRYWKEAGVAHKIELRLGPALDTLHRLLEDDSARESFDFVFIDADKSAYGAYYELALKLARRGGMILFDNMLWHGRVLDQDTRDADVMAIQTLNQKIHDDTRVIAVLVPIGDGMTVALKL